MLRTPSLAKINKHVANPVVITVHLGCTARSLIHRQQLDIRRVALTATGSSSGPMPISNGTDRQPDVHHGNAHASPSQSVNIHLYIPNLIGYLRLVLVMAAWFLAASQQAPVTAMALFLISATLDAFDGMLARKLNQVSGFGAFLDVWIDNLTRGILWTLSLPGGLSVIPIILETTTFLATHKGGGAAWKDGVFRDAPAWVRWLMTAGFRTPQGALLVGGLFGTPLWLWACRALPDTLWSTAYLGIPFITGRCMAAAVEVWVITRHVKGLIADDTELAIKQAQ